MRSKAKTNPKHIVVGTAGHVDHGKTALVRAMTGVYTDRLKEERERGISIEVGFAPYRLSSGQLISIIDVPGHERFVKNMLRGISGVDIALLVIAADDGPMPQTREHLDILGLLNIKEGLVVITKVDLVDDELLELATEEIMTLLKGTFPENTVPIYFSSETGQGLSEIKKALEEACNRVKEKHRAEGFRLPIDRVFTAAGYGTVVTGTIASGKIKEGDEVEIYPSDTTIKVRSIQVHNQQVKKAKAGQRVGIKLSRVRPSLLGRGIVLGEPGSLIPTHLINALFQYLNSNRRGSLKNKVRVRVYSGTSEVVGRMVFMDREELLPGDNCFVQFRLEERLAPVPFDKYIVRSLSPVSTIGGGDILEVNPRKYRKYDPELIRYLGLLERRNNHEVLEWLVKKGGYEPALSGQLGQKIGLKGVEVDRICTNLTEKKILIPIDDESVIHTERYETLRKKIIKKLKLFHRDNPLQMAMPNGALRTKVSLKLDLGLFEYVLGGLSRERIIEVESGGVRLADRQIRLTSKQNSIVNRVDAICRASGFRSVGRSKTKEVFDSRSKQEIAAILKFMALENQVVKLKDGRLIHADNMEKIKNLVKEHIQSRGKITPQGCRVLLDVGRDIYIPILEYLDDIKFTMRIGNHRVLHPEKKVSQA